FARYRERPILEGKKFVGSEVVSLPFAEHVMPDKDNPKQGTRMAPTFIDGKSPPGAGKSGGTAPINVKGKGFPKLPPKFGPFGKKEGPGNLSDEARRKAL